MSKKIRFIAVAVVSLALLTAGCQYSMSAAPQSEATPTLGSDFTTPLPAESQDPMKALEEQATQTALAQLGTVMPTDETPAEGTADATPVTPDAQATTETPPVDEATATPGPSLTPEPGGNVPATYTLRKGEFPYCLARRYNLNPTELLALNGLTDAQARALSVGLVLKLPQTGNPFPGDRALNPHPSGTVYTVKSSDETIYSIACFYGDVRPQQIINLNDLVEPYTLTVGQQLQIP
ncbi:MAG: LysM peptidoglycan-binding domain-containing protein [Chloroflexota bacterium]